LQTEYEAQGVRFLVVLLQDSAGNPATAANATTYSNQHDFNFPITNDGSGFFNNRLMGDGFPQNVIINVRQMTYEYGRAGMLTPTEIRDKLDDMLQ
jgi:hypothetical protein